MGKSKNIIFHEESDETYGRTRTVSRSDFKGFVEAGIKAAEGLEGFEDIYPDELRREAATATKMDALSYRCKESCGCPMTKVGAVILSPDPDKEWVGNAIDAFVSNYDVAVSRKFPNTGPLTLNIVSDEEFAAMQGSSV